MDISVGKVLGNLAGTLHLYEFCSRVGIEAFFYRICYKEQIQRTCSFYKKNESRVRDNAAMFSETKSKETYLKAIHFRKTHKLKDRPEFCKEEEYFNSLTESGSDEVLIDCGAYTGDSVEKFIVWSLDKYKKIVAFEPDKANYLKLEETLQGKHDCISYNAGVWNEEGVISFSDGNLAGSRIAECGRVKINTMVIDQCKECADATFIKMDIEGAELMALQGAWQTILRNRPILTICIYHTDEDMLVIPEWMRDNLTNYRFYCRHHSYFKEDTIMYAIPVERCR